MLKEVQVPPSPGGEVMGRPHHIRTGVEAATFCLDMEVEGW